MTLRIQLLRALRKAVLAATLGMVSLSASAAVVLLDENFDDVTGLSNPASVRTVASILGRTPTQLPDGTTIRPSDSPAINIRRGDSAINLSGGSSGFNSFFDTSSANRFLVLGDDNGAIGGSPNSGTFWIRMPFSLRPDSASITISFDFAFNGVDTSSATDYFSASIIGDTRYELFLIPSPLFASMNFSTLINVADLPKGPLALEFQLVEAAGTGTNTAVGIDNILITNASHASVPEPLTLVLFAGGLFALAITRRKHPLR